LDRHIIHVHIPSFPIAAARVIRPELRAGLWPWLPSFRASPHSLCLSRSRQEGIFKGMPLGKAMKFCPGLTVLPPDHDLTAKACQVLAGVVARYTPLWEPSCPGHMYLDVTGTDRLWGEPKMRQTVSGGKSRNRSDFQEPWEWQATKWSPALPPNSCALKAFWTWTTAASPPSWPSQGECPSRHRSCAKKNLLEELNITLVRQIVVLDMGSLKLVFGQQAYVVHQRALGIDPTPVFPPTTEPTVAEEVTLPQDENDDEKLLGVLYGLVEKCSYQLRSRSLLPRKAGICFRYADQEQVTRHVQVPNPVSGL